MPRAVRGTHFIFRSVRSIPPERPSCLERGLHRADHLARAKNHATGDARLGVGVPHLDTELPEIRRATVLPIEGCDTLCKKAGQLQA